MKLSSIFDPLKGLFGQSNKAKILTTSKTSAGKLTQFDKSIGDTIARGEFFTSAFDREIYPITTLQKTTYANPLEIQLASMPSINTLTKMEEYSPYKSEAVLKNGIFDQTLLKQNTLIAKKNSLLKSINDIIEESYNTETSDIHSTIQKTKRKYNIELSETEKELFKLKNKKTLDFKKDGGRDMFYHREYVEYLTEYHKENPFISSLFFNTEDFYDYYNSYIEDRAKKLNPINALAYKEGSKKTPEEFINALNNLDLNVIEKSDYSMQDWARHMMKTEFEGPYAFKLEGSLFPNRPYPSVYSDDTTKLGIHLYTGVGKSKNWSFPANNFLEGRPVSLIEKQTFPKDELLSNIKIIDDALKKSPKYEGISYRYITIDDPTEFQDFVKQHRVGNIIENRQYLSTTKSASLEPDTNLFGAIFQDEYNTYRDNGFKIYDKSGNIVDGKERQYIIYQINGKTAADISGASHIPQQSEATFERNRQFIVTATRKRSGNIYELIMNELDPKEMV